MQHLLSPEIQSTPNSHIPSNFKERALPLIKQGISVIPLVPKDKKALIDDWPNRASNDKKQIEAWNFQWPDANVGCVATYGYCYLDDDRGDLKDRIEQETGKKLPETFTVETSTKSTGMRGRHFYFKRTEHALRIGNCAEPLHFDFQCIDKQVVGPYSVHPSGMIYLPVDENAPIAEIPDWLCDWIEENTPKNAKSESDGNGPQGSEEFDHDDWLNHYSDVFSTSLDGEWHVTSICPLTYTGEATGHKHHGSTKTGFRFCNSTPEFHCFSTDPCEDGMPHDQASFGDVVRHLNKYHETYQGEIWEKQDDSDDDDWADFGDDAEFCVPSKSESEAQGPPTSEGEPKAGAKPKLLQLVAIESEQGHVSRLVGIRMSDVEAVPLRWLWPDKFPMGKVGLVTGIQGGGKSLLLIDLMARVTTGVDWPDGTKNVHGPKTVLLAASEDDANDTLKPRLMAAGADLSRVIKVEWSEGHERPKRRRDGKEVGEARKVKRSLQLKDDAAKIKKLVQDNPEVALLVLDPLASYIGEADTNKDTDMRPLFDALARVCQQTGLTVIGLMHLNKRSDVRAEQKVQGASSVVGSARIVWGVSHDSEDKSKHHFAFVKGNLNAGRSGLSFTIGTKLVDIRGEQIPYPFIVWGDKLDEDANDLLDEERQRQREGGGEKKIDMASLLLKSQLPARARELFDKAEAEGISEKTLKRAKYRLKVESIQQAGAWWWYLPGTKPEAKANSEEMIPPDFFEQGVM
jgi:hypothetical protein